ncbi:hypothetical protein LPN04_31600 [Rugamonas sp. A1-17]|nr:hypothetical protein [Rugamonas sp. A1-17]
MGTGVRNNYPHYSPSRGFSIRKDSEGPSFPLIRPLSGKTKGENTMYVAAPKKPVVQPTHFHIGDTGETSPNFIQGISACKACRSHKLDHYKYLDDAKCGECGQWQNEDPLPN